MEYQEWAALLLTDPSNAKSMNKKDLSILVQFWLYMTSECAQFVAFVDAKCCSGQRRKKDAKCWMKCYFIIVVFVLQNINTNSCEIWVSIFMNVSVE